MQDNGPLSGCVALVTGASSGIGEATAVALADRGASVALAARRAERLAELAETVRDKSGSASQRSTVLTADLGDAEQARQTVEETVEQLGRLDVLVNNAGFAVRGPAQEADFADWQKMVDLNVTALLRTSHAALPHLLRAAAEGDEGPRGPVADLVNISSVAGRVARRDNGVYAATKHAVGAFSESLRQEATGRGVRVGLVEPGLTATGMTESGTSMAGAARTVPRGSWLGADDIARTVAFMVTQPPHAAINEILVRPTAQEH